MILSPPSSRQDFTIAIICAVPVEAHFAELIFDKFWEDEGKDFGKVKGDPNAYTTGVVARHNAVLAHIPTMGKVGAAGVASTLKISFSGIKLAIVVGLCGGVPQNVATREEIILGDVVISQALIQYDFGRQYPEAFSRKDTIEDNLGRPSPEIRGFLAKLRTPRSRQELQKEMSPYLDLIRQTDAAIEHPGIQYDKLYDPAYIHKHHMTNDVNCAICREGHSCTESRLTSCEDLECEEARLIQRQRLAGTIRYSPSPIVHFGKIGSGDSVMKSGILRDKMAQEDGIIAFEMEGAGLWDHFPSLIVKGVCDYADSHKNKTFQSYAAATAACCTKALLKRWSEGDEISEIARTQQLIRSAPDALHDDISRKSADNLPNSVWHVPSHRMQSFVGREQEVRTLRLELFDVGPWQKVAIFGLGGVGKSRIAWEMASHARSLGQYSIFWVQSNSISSFELDYMQIGRKMKIPGLEAQGSDVKELVARWLSTEAAGRWLLILDNADDETIWCRPRTGAKTSNTSMTAFIPRSRFGSTLITTRSRKVAVQLAGKNVVKLQQMDEVSAVSLLNSLLISADDKNDLHTQFARNLVKALAYLPLAIVQAAAYMNIKDISAHDYADILNDTDEQNIIDLLSEDFEDDSRYQHAQNSIASTWLLSFEEIQKTNARAVELLSYISCLNEKDLPQELLPDVFSKKELVDIVGILTGYSFITKQIQQHHDDVLYDMHRLVRLATRNWLRSQGTLQDWIKTAIERTLQLFLYGTDRRRRCKLYMPHAETLCASQESWDLIERYELLYEMGNLSYLDGAFEVAATYFSYVLTWRVRHMGPMTCDSLVARERMGTMLLYSGRFSEGEKHITRALSGLTEIVGREHTSTITAMSSLAEFHMSQRQYLEAERLLNQVVKSCKLKYGLRHVRTLRAISDLSRVYMHLRRLEEAEALAKEVVEANEEPNDLDDLSKAACKLNLANIYINHGRYSEALLLAPEVEEACARVYDSDHPHALIYFCLRPRICIEQNRHVEAELILTDLLKRVRKGSDQYHIDILSTKMELGHCFVKAKRYPEAEQIHTEILRSCEEKLGYGTSITLWAMDHLALTMWKSGKRQSACNLLSERIARGEATFGVDDSHAWWCKRTLERWRQWLT